MHKTGEDIVILEGAAPRRRGGNGIGGRRSQGQSREPFLISTDEEIVAELGQFPHTAALLPRYFPKLS